MSQSPPLPPPTHTLPPSPVVRKECLSCRSNGSWDDWSGGKETRVIIGLQSVRACIHLCMHVQYACHVHVCVPPAFVCVPACLRVWIPCTFTCVLVCLYSNGDTRTLGTTLTWPNSRPRRTPVTVWRERWGTEENINRQRENETPLQLVAALASFKSVPAIFFFFFSFTVSEAYTVGVYVLTKLTSLNLDRIHTEEGRTA